MTPFQEHKGRHAVVAFREAVGVAPAAGSDGRNWRNVSACFWRTPWLSSYELAGTDELIVALHIGGSHNVRTRVHDGWSDTASNPGHLHLVPAGFATAFRPEGTLEFASVHISPERLRALTDRTTKQALAFRFAFYDPFVSSCVHALLNELHTPRECGALFVDSVTDALFLHLLCGPGAAAALPGIREALPARALARVCEYIEANLETDLTLDELAAHAHLSRFHFARAFREAMNMPPHRFLTLRRIERGKELLLHTNMPLAEIALAAGFSSQSHFAARFRELVGDTPRRFRASHGGAGARQTAIS